MKRWLYLIWTQLWLTGVVGLVLLALYTSLGRQLIPLVETLDEKVEDILSAQLGLPVAIGSLVGDWSWFSPILKVNDIALGESADQLHAEHLEAELDISASLFHRSLVFKKVILSGVRLSAFQDQNFVWHVGEFALTSNGQEVAPDPMPNQSQPLWLELLSQQGELQLLDWKVDIQAFAEEKKKIELIDIRLRNKSDQHWLDGEVRLGGELGAILKTQFEVEGDLWDFAESNGRGYVEVEPREWSSWLPIKNDNLKLQKLKVGGKLWVELKQGLLQTVDGYLEIPEFSLFTPGDNYPQSLDLIDGRITLAGRRDEEDWHLWFDTQGQWLSQLAPSLPQGRLSYLAGFAGGWQLSLAELDLETTSFVIEDFELLPQAYADFVINLQPQGLAKDIHVNLIPEQDWRWGLNLDLQDTSVIGWHGIPTLENVNAKVQLNAKKGIAKVRNNDTVLHFPDLYPIGWDLQQLSTNVYWQIEHDYLRLVGPSIRADYEAVKGQEGEIAGGFSLYLPLHKSKVEPQLNLSLGFSNISTAAQQQFLPPAALPNLSEWLDYNIHDGEINEGSFLYSGYVGKSAPKESLTVQLYLDIEDARLSYLPGWPQLTDVNAKLMLDSPSVNIWLHSANTLGGKLVTNTGRIRVRTDVNKIPWMTIKGELQGSAQEGLEYLQTTPLREQLNNGFDQWRAKGALESKFYARIPLAQPQKNELLKDRLIPKIRLTSDLDNVDVSILDLNVELKNILGQIKFDSESGLSSEKLASNIFGGRVLAQISSEKVNDNFEIKIDAEGQAKVDAIKAWQPIFIFKPIEGDLKYSLSLNVKPINRGGLSLTINSELAGVNIDTPAPFGKKSEDTIPFQLSVKSARDMRLSFIYGDWANGVMVFDHGELSRGQIYLGTTQAYLPSDDGLRINGNLPVKINAKAWWDLWNDIVPTRATAAASGESESSSESKVSEEPLLTHIDISAPNVNAWETPMGATHIIGNYKWEQWQFNITSDLVKGDIILSDGDEPIELVLDYIHIPIGDELKDESIKFGSNEVKDSLQDIDPGLIPALNLKVEEIFSGTSNFGRWDLTIRQTPDFTQVHINDSLSKAFKIQGDINWSFNEEGHKTHLELMRISSDNIGDSQRAFRMPAAIESENARFDIDMSWAGSPLKFNYETLNGLAKVSIKDGVLVSDNAAALKIFGVLNFSSIKRRLKLDFSDLYKSGVVFDRLKARMSIEDGVATLVDPLIVTSPSAKFLASGTVDFNTEVVNQKLVVTFPIGSSLPLVAVIAGLAPAIAGAIYVTEKLIGEELEKFTSASYTVTGTMDNPKLTIDQAFDNNLDGKESRSFTNRILDIFGLGSDE
jgi:uncharacterized protein (TIGR02099 family)